MFCKRCGDSHAMDTCTSDISCLACAGPHMIGHSTCEQHQYQQQIQKYVAVHNTTYNEAKHYLKTLSPAAYMQLLQSGPTVQGSFQTLPVPYTAIVQQSSTFPPLDSEDTTQLHKPRLAGIKQLNSSTSSKRHISTVLDLESSAATGEPHQFDIASPREQRTAKTPRRTITRLPVSSQSTSPVFRRRPYQTSNPSHFLPNLSSEEVSIASNLSKHPEASASHASTPLSPKIRSLKQQLRKILEGHHRPSATLEEDISMEDSINLDDGQYSITKQTIIDMLELLNTTLWGLTT